VVADLADRVAVMSDGEVVEQAPVRELFAAPIHPYTRGLLSAVPIFDGGGRMEASAPDGERPVVRASGLVVDNPGRLGRKGFRAVDGVSFEIGPRQVLGLVGESGSGKTTIGRAVAGLTTVTGGQLDVFGEQLPIRRRTRTRSQAGRIGYVFQDPAASFNPLLTVADSIAEPLIVHRRELGAKAVRAEAEALLESVHLPRSYADRYPTSSAAASASAPPWHAHSPCGLRC